MSSSCASLLVVRPSMGQGGADRVTLVLLSELDRSRLDPSLALMHPEGALFEALPPDLEIHDLGGGSLWTAWLPLTRLVRKTRPDILLSTSSGANLIVCVAALLSGRRARVVLSERNVLRRQRSPVKQWIQLLAKKFLYRVADCVTAVSEGVRADLVDQLRLPARKTRVVYNPVVTPELELQVEAARDSESPFPRPFVLGVGRLLPVKGFDILIRAFARSDKPDDLHLVILGEGPSRSDLTDLAIALGVDKKVHFPGFKADPCPYMSHCELFVLASRHEGLPGALIQAMACGAPVLSTDCHAGPAEIIDDASTGYLTPVDDIEAMAERIDALIPRPAERLRLAAAGRKAVARFSLDTVMKGYLDALLDSDPNGETKTDE